MRIITEKRLAEYMRDYADARAALTAWIAIVRKSRWASIDDLRVTFPSADGVPVRSGRTVTVFNIRGNRYRLITAIHYNRECIYILRLLTHAEYDKDQWKETL